MLAPIFAQDHCFPRRSPAGRLQSIRSGSYVEIPLAVGAIGPTLAFSVHVFPTNPGADEQCIASVGDVTTEAAWGLSLSATGEAELVVGKTRISTGAAVNRWTWYRVECTVKAGRATVRQTPLRTWPGDRSAGEGHGDVVMPTLTEMSPKTK